MSPTLEAEPGHFVFAFARVVGKQGKVYSLDVRKDLLETITGYARTNGFFQVSAVHCDLERENGSTLMTDSLDIVLCSNILSQVGDQNAIIKEASRVLKQGGKLIIFEWEGGSFLSPQNLFTKTEAQKLAVANNFQGFNDVMAGEHHYGLVCKMG